MLLVKYHSDAVFENMKLLAHQCYTNGELFLSPLSCVRASSNDCLNQNLLNNFAKSCQNISEMFIVGSLLHQALP